MNDTGEITAQMLMAPTINQDKAHQNETEINMQGSLSGSESSGANTLLDIEKNAIENALNSCQGNIPQAAALLGVSPSTIYRKRQAWDKSF